MQWLIKNLREMEIIAALCLKSAHTRVRGSLVIVAALMFVCAVVLSMLGLDEGMKLAYLRAGFPDRAVVLSLGASSEITSSISESWLGFIRDSPGIRKGGNGVPMIDAELSAITGGTLLKRSNGKPGYTTVKGMGVTGLDLSPEIKMIDGRRYRAGTREAMVGVLAQQKFSGLEIGDRVQMLDSDYWTVVGHFSTGSFMDGEVLVDSPVMLTALRRTGYGSVLVGLRSVASLAEFRDALTAIPALSVTIESQSNYWRRQFESLPSTLVLVAYAVGVLLGAGAVSGILHTMQSTVEARAAEIAILRAVGFGGLPVAVSIVLEAMCFAAVGAAAGTGIDWILFNGYAYNGGWGVFQVQVTPRLFAVAMGWALAIALVGALAPALKEARLPMVDALNRV